MARDRSLDEFLGGESEEPEPREDDGPESQESGDPEDRSDEGDTEDPEVEDDSDVDSVEPAAVEATMAFSPEGADCAACGATVERRWQGESGPVCADCKEW